MKQNPCLWDEAYETTIHHYLLTQVTQWCNLSRTEANLHSWWLKTPVESTSKFLSLKAETFINATSPHSVSFLVEFISYDDKRLPLTEILEQVFRSGIQIMYFKLQKTLLGSTLFNKIKGRTQKCPRVFFISQMP